MGDCAHMAHAPRPKAGVFAVRQAPVLHHNLRALVQSPEGALRQYHPQRDYLKLVSMGGKTAMADRSGTPHRRGWLWRLKDRIDRAFMDKFANLPTMPAPRCPPSMQRVCARRWEKADVRGLRGQRSALRRWNRPWRAARACTR